MNVTGMDAVVVNGARAVPDCVNVPITPELACDSVNAVPAMFATVVPAAIPSPSTVAYCATPVPSPRVTAVAPDAAAPVCTSVDMALTAVPAATPVPDTA